jgi:hypothetical protein
MSNIDNFDKLDNVDNSDNSDNLDNSDKCIFKVDYKKNINKMKINFNKLFDSIPKPHYYKPIVFKDKSVEIRCRILKINQIDFVELSILKPNTNRKYLNNTNEWIEYDVSNKYDIYVVKTIYSYLAN